MSLLVAVALVLPAGATPPPAAGFVLGGLACHLIGVPHAPAAGPTLVSSQACRGVRPGAVVTTSVGLCTLNFLFDGSDGHRYIGTAGHCILGDGPIAEDVGEKVWRSGGPRARDADGEAIGRFGYAILKSPKDFALIRLYRSVSASPKLCVFGGPTGVESARGGAALLHYYGNGAVVGDVLPARSAVATSTAHPDHVYAYGTAIPGDSGSAVVTDRGRALGVLVTTGVHFEGATDAGLMGITRLAPQVARAEKKLGIKLRLVTATFTG